MEMIIRAVDILDKISAGEESTHVPVKMISPGKRVAVWLRNDMVFLMLKIMSPVSPS